MVGVKYSFAGLLVLLSALGLVLAGCGGSGDLDNQLKDDAAAKNSSAAPVYDLDFDGRTDKPAQVMALPGANYTVEPLLTVADEIPLLTGNYPNGKAHKKRTFALPGIPDGLGIYKKGDNYWVWSNHEMGNTAVSRYSDTISGQIKGARVSLIKLDKNFSIIGGRNLIENIYDKTGLIGSVTLNSDSTAVSQTGTALNRLCSAALTDIYGNKPYFFAGEESTNGRGLLIEPDGNASVINDAVKMAYENLVPVSKWKNKTVMLLLDDTSDKHLVLYVGNRIAGDLGFNSGTCYVAQIWVNGQPQANTSGLSLNASNTVKWVQVPRTYDFDGAGPNPPQDLYASTAPYYQWALLAKATQFKRIEDGHEDPAKPGEIHFATTGNTGAGSYDLYGRIWHLSLGGQPTADGALRLTSIGNTNYYMNPDNVAADSRGQFWLQEDPSGTQNLMLAAGRVASIYRSPIGADSYVRLFEVNQDRAPFNTYGIPSFKDNPWETSGIVELPGVVGNGQVGVLFDTQAHGWADADYVEGGQLILAFPKGFILPPAKGGSAVKGQKYEIKPENADESTGDDAAVLPAATRKVGVSK